MKYLIASDLHGSLYYTQKLFKQIENEKPNKIVLLGDLYYHGPRNPLPKDYNPKEVSNLLNSIKHKLICIKGNCDAEVDQMISEFKIMNQKIIKVKDSQILFTHGHKFNADNPKDNIDIMFYGHFHKNKIIKNNDKIFINVGSTSLPKNNSANSYAILTENEIILKDLLSAKIIDSIKF